MAEQRLYNAPDLDLSMLGQALVQWFQQQGFEAQVLQGPEGGYVVQARRAETWRSLVGMSAALNVSLIREDSKLLVRMGAAQWADKAVVGAVGALVFWPALIPAAVGAWKQKQLPDQVFRFIDQYIALGGQVTESDLARIMRPAAVAAPAAANQVACPSCGQPIRQTARFCDNCGASLKVACAKCGAELRPGARFCDGCGAPVEGAKSA